MNKIILTADCEIEDKKLREIVEKLWTRVETLNDRTKRLTKEIQDLRKNKS